MADLYVIESINETANVASVKKSLWQKFLENFGNLNIRDLKYLVDRNCVHGIKVTGNEKLPVCEICVQEKLACIPFKKSDTTSSEVLELVDTDICGPMRVQSLSGSRYFATFVDDKTRYYEIAFLKNKNDIFEKFTAFKTRIEKQTGKKIKSVRSDNGRGYLSNSLKNFSESKISYIN